MRSERRECQCLACAQLQHQQANDTLLLVAIGTVLVVGGLVWLVGQVAGLLAAGSWPEVPLSELPGILVRLRDYASDPAAAWPAEARDGLPGPLGMYSTLAGILLIPLALGALAWWLHRPPTLPRPPATPPRPGPAGAATGRAFRRTDVAVARAPPGGTVTATTLGVQAAGLTGRGRNGGDAQERPATNPVAALSCARTPLLTPLPIPLLIPPSATVGADAPDFLLFGLVEAPDPGRSRANPARDRPGSRWSRKQWRATHARLHAGAVVSGRPPTNYVGGLPPGSPGHPHYAEWWDG
jgi:hypothetical protein